MDVRPHCPKCKALLRAVLFGSPLNINGEKQYFLCENCHMDWPEDEFYGSL